MLNIRILTTDQTLVPELNSSGIAGASAKYDPTMAYDSAERVCEIVISAIATGGLKLAGEWLVARWKKKPPSQISINNQVVNNAEHVTIIINNVVIEKKDAESS
jgi:hypothetical protein